MDLKFSVGVQIVGNNLWNNRLILGSVVMSIVDLYKCLLHILMNFEEKRIFITFPVMNWAEHPWFMRQKWTKCTWSTYELNNWLL